MESQKIGFLKRFFLACCLLALAIPVAGRALELRTLQAKGTVRVPLAGAASKAFAVASPDGIGAAVFNAGIPAMRPLIKALGLSFPADLPRDPRVGGLESVLRQREWQALGLERFQRQRKTQAMPMASGSSPGTYSFYLDLTGLVPGKGVMVIQAKLIEQTKYAKVYQEEGISVEPGLVPELVRRIDDLIVPRDRLLFGQESDINGDAHFSVLLTDRFKNSGAVGFFSAADLFPRRIFSNPSSNQQEILYATPVTGGVSRNLLYATIAHEYQHLINFSRRIYEIPNAVPEEVWLNEGLSYMAEDNCGLGDDSNGPPAMSFEYLQSAPDASLTGPDIDGKTDTAAQRGAAYLFLRYLFEQAGGTAGFDTTGNLVDRGGAAFTRKLISSGLAGRANLEKATGRPFKESFVSWVATLMADGMLGLKEQGFRYDPPKKDAITGQTVGIALRGNRSVNCDNCRGNRVTIPLDGPASESDPSGSWTVQGGSARFFDPTASSPAYVDVTFRGDSGLLAVYLAP
ncbi:MAG: hypothetical protein SVK44_04965 [Nitrospirota bacterium]|nr:hypothetical protein [Nitrospirota bacterium]